MKKYLIVILVFSLILNKAWSNDDEEPTGSSTKTTYNTKSLSKQYKEALVYKERGNMGECINLCERLIPNAYNAKDYLMQAKLNTLAGKAYYAQGNKKAAKRKFEASLDILLRNNIADKSLLLDNYNYLLLCPLNADEVKVIQARKGVLSNLGQKQPALSAIYNDPLFASNLLTEQEKIKKLTKNYEEELKISASKINEMSQVQMRDKLLMAAQERALMNVRYFDSLNRERLKIQDLTLSGAESRRNFYLVAMAFLALLLGGSIYLFLKSKKTSDLLEEKNKLIEKEQEKTESLLLNIFPRNVVQELKDHGFSKAKHFENACVSFLDFVSFSKISEQYSPQTVLDDLNTCFKAFDDILSKYNLEKIKTIGDCYMFAGGLADSDDGNQIHKSVKAAKEMLAWLEIWNNERVKKGLIAYEARVGIHSGPVAAGVVGSKRNLYDIWGDTVNTASRMETNSEKNRINISHVVYKALKGLEKCTYRGEIEAKNKGLLKMYFIE